MRIILLMFTSQTIYEAERWRLEKLYRLHESEAAQLKEGAIEIDPPKVEQQEQNQLQ